MDWNYDFAVAEVFVLLTLFAYFSIKKRLPLYRGNSFLALLLVEAATLLTDMLGAFASRGLTSFKLILAASICNTLYFMLYYMRNALLFFMTMYFIDRDIQKKRSYTITAVGSFLTLELLAVTSTWTHLVFYVDETGYHNGPLYKILYVQFACYFVVSLVQLVRKWKTIKISDRNTIVAYGLVLLVGNICRYFLKGFIVMNLFCLVSIILIYLDYVDPAYTLDYRTNLYNETGLMALLREWIGKRDYVLDAVVVKNLPYIKEVYNDNDVNEAMKQIGEFLKKEYPESKCFFMKDGYFVLLSRVLRDSGSLYESIKKRFESPWVTKGVTLYLNPGFVAFDSSVAIENENELKNNLQAAVRSIVSPTGPEFLSLSDVHKQVAVKKQLENAIANEKVALFLQPIAEASTNRIVGAEALARIYTEDGRIIMPGEFISYAEEDGSIMALGLQMFEKSCAFLKEYQEKTGIEWINVNLSPIQCMNQSLPKQFYEIARKYGISTSRVHLEITEETMIDSNILHKQMNEMLKFGFQFSLDDFGSGYSNIEPLAEYPLTTVKLDRGIVDLYFEKRSKVLPAIVEIFREMQFNIVAEGVENAEMAQTLREMGIHYLQGFYYSKPISADEFVLKYQSKA